MASDDPFAWPLDPAIYVCRVKYAAFLYDALKPRYGHSKALGLAVREAQITGDSLRQALPGHRRKDRILRNEKIIKYRSWGYSVDLIAESLDINRATVTRALDAFKTRMNAIEKVSRYKIRGRLKFGDPRINDLPLPAIEISGALSCGLPCDPLCGPPSSPPSSLS